MSDEVTIALRAEGLDEVSNALKGVKETIISSERDSTRAVLEGARSRINALRQEGREKEKLAKQIAKAENDLNRTFGHQNMGTRNAMVGSNTSNLPSGGGLNNILSSLGGASGSLGSLAGKAGLAGAAFAGVKAGVDMAIEGLKMFGSFLINDIIKPGFELQTLAQQVANNSRGGISAQDAEQKARAIGVRYNIDPKVALESIANFGETTGNYDLGVQTTDLLAMIQKAYGGKVEDYSNLASNIYRPGMSYQDLQNNLLSQIGQGQVEGGKYTIKQIAGLGGKINEPASRIAGNTDVALGSTTALVQQTGKTVGSVDESMTAVRSFINEISANKGGKFGKLLTEEGKVTDVRQALIESLIATKGGQARYMKQAGFTSEESSKVLAAYTEEYAKAMEGLPNTTENQRKAAEKATEAFMRIALATTDLSNVQNDAAKTLATPGQELEKVLGELKDKLAAEILPEMDGFVKDFVKMAPQLIQASLTLAKVFIVLADAVMSIAKLFGYVTKGSETEQYYAEFGTKKQQFIDPVTGEIKIGPNMVNANVPDTPVKFKNYDPNAPKVNTEPFGPPIPNNIPSSLKDVVTPPVTNTTGTTAKNDSDEKAAKASTNLATSLAQLQAQVDEAASSVGDFNRKNPLKRD